MSPQPTSRKARRRVEAPVMEGVGKAVIYVDVQPVPGGHRWDAEVIHPFVQASRHGFAATPERARVEAIGWLSAAADGLQQAEAILYMMVEGLNEAEPTPPSV